MHDERVARILAEMTEELTPQPDPYGRLRARHRRGRRRQAAVALSLAAVLTVTGVTVAGPGLGGAPGPSPIGGSTEAGQRMLAWAERLVESPPRGAVAADADYVATLSETLLAEQRAGKFDRLTAPVRAVKVLFVDDIGDQRIGLAAIVRTEPDPATGWVNSTARMIAGRGASAQELGRSAAGWVGDGLEPYVQIGEDIPTTPDRRVHVAIAPDGCAFATAALTELTDGETGLTDWKAEPTGSYIVRTPQTVRPEWWQVSCAGVVRKRLPGPGWFAPAGITDTQLARAIAGVRGKVDQLRLRDLLWRTTQSWGYAITEIPTVIWNGRTPKVPADPALDGGATTVLAAPAAGGGWLGEVQIDYDRPMPDSRIAAGASFSTQTDPNDPASVLAVPLSDGGSTLLVVTPTKATAVRAVRDGREVARAQVTDAGAVLEVPGTTGIVLEAVDAAGTVLATGGVAGNTGSGLAVDKWDED